MSIFDDIKKRMGAADAGEKPMDAQSQPPEDKELAGYVKNKVEEVRSQAVRTTHEGIWMTNIAYMLGFDSIYYDPAAKQFRPAGSTGGAYQFVKRNRIHENIILPAVQNRLARMLKNPPKYDVRPNSMEEDDKESARLGIDIINLIWDKQKINRKRIDLGMWLQECGHSYIRVCYDDQLGEPLMDPETNEMLGFEGDVRIDVVSAFEGFCDPLAKNFEDASWFASCKVRKLDYFRTHYPERGDLVKEEGVWLLSSQYEMRINTLNTVGPASSGTAEQMKGAAIEISYYEKRSQKYPMGRHVIVANGVLLKNGELAVGEIPYAKFDDIVIGGKYYSETPVTHARPLQDQYNRTLAKRADWVNKLLAGKYIAAKGHGVSQESLNDQSGEFIEYNVVPGAKEPHAVDLPTIPNYAYEEGKQIKQGIYDIFGSSDISRGVLPSASIPAKGMEILLESDETRLGVEISQHEYSWARVGMLILKYVDKYYVTDRKLKTKGKNLQYDIKSFNGESLKKNFDVTVIAGSTLPNSKVMHRQEIINLMNQGLLGNPQDPAVVSKVLGMLQYGDIGEAWEEHHLIKTQINKTLRMIEQEIQPVVDKKDNHLMHFVDKNQYRISDKFDQLTPMAQQMLQLDIQTHLDFLVGQTAPELATPPVVPPPPMPNSGPPMPGPPGPPPGP